MKTLNAARFLKVVIIALTAVVLAACATRQLDDQSSQKMSTEKAEQQRRASIRMQLAVSYYQQGQTKFALDEVRQAIAAEPEMADAYALRALIFMDLGENQLADENFQYALKLVPANLDYMNNYGWFLCQSGREKQGLQYLEKAARDPAYSTPAKALNNAGVCAMRLRELDRAEKYFMDAFKLEPGNPGVNVNLSKIYLDRGDLKVAQFYINRVVRQDVLTADVLWQAIKIERRMGDEAAVNGLSAQLGKRYPNSREFGLLQRGLFNE